MNNFTYPYSYTLTKRRASKKRGLRILFKRLFLSAISQGSKQHGNLEIYRLKKFIFRSLKCLKVNQQSAENVSMVCFTVTFRSDENWPWAGAIVY